MSKTNKKESYKERHGTTRVGDALRWFSKAGKNIGTDVLDLASKITGIDSLEVLRNAIKKDEGLTEQDKQVLLAELEQDKIEMQEVTKRWQADMVSDSFLSKNIRPLTLAALVIALFVFVIWILPLQDFRLKRRGYLC